MTYYDEKKNVEEYIKMAKGYDGRDLIAVLKKQLPAGSTILELGMGPGVDLDLLGRTYVVTGSDSSRMFLEIYRKRNPGADLLHLEAVGIETKRTFDCIYSNKVLQHLSEADLRRSINRQKQLLNKNGVLMHSFWYGDKEEEQCGLQFVYYTEDELKKTLSPDFEIMAMERYGEIEDDDSLYVLLRKLG